jgi:hypothetical protein
MRTESLWGNFVYGYSLLDGPDGSSSLGAASYSISLVEVCD